VVEARPVATRTAAAALVALAALLGAVVATVATAAGPAGSQPAQDQGSGSQAPPGAADCIVIDDLARSRIGEFPSGWEVRKEEGRRVYSVQEEGGLRFLRAASDGLGVQAARAHEWDLEQYPVLAWSWRPRQFPAGADEQRGKNDSALAVYMLVPHSRVAGPKAVKYIWSETVPVGTRLESNRGLTQVKVLRSGAEGLGRWVEERANVRDDYRALFKVSESPKPAGIAVLTDADDTGSRARGDYARFRVCRQ
jgi:hypothetical protein